MLMLAALLFGLTCGAETDVIAYLIVRNFGVRIYSTVYGILAATVAIAATIGAVLVSVMLSMFGKFAPFLMVAGVFVVIGSLLFLLLPSNPVLADEPEDHAEDNTARDLAMKEPLARQ